MQVTLRLPYPPSMNCIWRSEKGRVHRSRDYKNYINQVLSICFPYTVGRRESLFLGDVMVVSSIIFPDNRKRDIDNLTKPIFDSLTKARIWRDDSQVKAHLHFAYSCNKDFPSVVVTVFDYDYETKYELIHLVRAMSLEHYEETKK